MAKSKHFHHKKAGFTIPLAVVAGFAVPIMDSVGYYKNGGFQHALNHFTGIMTGYNVESKAFHAGDMKAGLVPVLAGIAIHKFIGGNLGVNRMLARSGVPILRL